MGTHEVVVVVVVVVVVWLWVFGCRVWVVAVVVVGSRAPALSPIVLLGAALFQSFGPHTVRKCRFVHACRGKVVRRCKSEFVRKPTAP